MLFPLPKGPFLFHLAIVDTPKPSKKKKPAQIEPLLSFPIPPTANDFFLLELPMHFI